MIAGAQGTGGRAPAPLNLPIGAATIALGRALIPEDDGLGAGRVDWLGSILVTASLMTAIYAIVQATGHGWGSSPVLGFGALAAGLMAAFLTVEARIENPIVPPRVLRLRGLIGASVVLASSSPACTRPSFSGRCTWSTSAITERSRPVWPSCPGR